MNERQMDALRAEFWPEGLAWKHPRRLANRRNFECSATGLVRRVETGFLLLPAPGKANPPYSLVTGKVKGTVRASEIFASHGLDRKPDAAWTERARKFVGLYNGRLQQGREFEPWAAPVDEISTEARKKRGGSSVQPTPAASRERRAAPDDTPAAEPDWQSVADAATAPAIAPGGPETRAGAAGSARRPVGLMMAMQDGATAQEALAELNEPAPRPARPRKKLNKSPRKLNKRAPRGDKKPRSVDRPTPGKRGGRPPKHTIDGEYFCLEMKRACAPRVALMRFMLADDSARRVPLECAVCPRAHQIYEHGVRVQERDRDAA